MDEQAWAHYCHFTYSSIDLPTSANIMANSSEGIKSSAASPESSRSSRGIHFPADHSSPSRSQYLPPPETPQRTSILALRTLPPRRGSPLNPQSTSPSNARRRVRSVDTTDVVDATRSRRTPAISLVETSRTLTPLYQRNPEILAEEDTGIFSDEYDLCV